MSIENLPEFTKNIRDNYGNSHRVDVNKIGGGTVGKKYSQEYWDVKIYNPRGEMVYNTTGFRSRGLYIGEPSDHEMAAFAAFAWYDTED